MKFTPDMITQDMITAAENVFVAMAFAETIRPIVRKYQTRILKRHQYHISPEFTRYGEPDKIILNPEDSWLLADADFQVYHAECKKCGRWFTLPKRPGKCPRCRSHNIEDRGK